MTKGDAHESGLSSQLLLVLAAACGLIVANLYYAQPLAGPIGAELGLSEAATGLIVTLTQIGYGLGLILLVPLGDLVENRLLVVGLIVLTALALAAEALATAPGPFFAASLLMGMAAVAAQVVVPFAAHLAPEARRGRAVGSVMSGLMLGIMLARPVASLIASVASWHLVFGLSSAAMLLLAALLRISLPRRDPRADATGNEKLGYAALIGSMGRLALSTPILVRRSLYQAALFAAFSLFWTVSPLYLTGPDYGLTQRGVALFALAGVAGAVASPIAGRLADRGFIRPATMLALIGAILSFALTHFAAPGSRLGLALMTIAAILLDSSVTTSLVVGQRAIFALGAEKRSRLNGLFIATFFAGGAFGSAIGGWAYAQGGWGLASLIGGVLPVPALAWLLGEGRARRAH